jgi:hypothetical protein
MDCGYLSIKVVKNLLLRLDEHSDASIPGAFDIIREITGWQFAHAAMIRYTFTTDPFTGTWFIRTITVFHILLLILTRHCKTPFRVHSFWQRNSNAFCRTVFLVFW